MTRGVARRIGRRLGRRERDERGAIAIVTGIFAVVLLVIAGFCVDIGNSWAVRGLLQDQADHAAIEAANDLPVKLSGPQAPATKLKVAMHAAYYIACHPVRGQRLYDPSVPLDADQGGSVTCDDNYGQSALSAYAAKMLATGMVTFPTSTSVTVTGPAARVDFGFGPGSSGKGVGEQKTATAAVYSPGAQAPIALGLQCTLSAAGAAPLGIDSLATGAVPLNYIAAGPLGANTSTEPSSTVTLSAMPNGGPGTLAATTAVPPGLLPTSQVESDNGSGNPLLTVNLLNLPGTTTTTTTTVLGVTTTTTTTLPGGTGTVRLHFYRGTASALSFNTRPYVSTAGIAAVAGFIVPTSVSSTPGIWYVQAEYQPTGSTTWTATTKATYQTYTVTLPAGVESLTACANLIDSPRRDTNNGIVVGETMRRNIKTGMDHSLEAHPSLATLNPPTYPVTAGSVLNTLNNSPSITDCTGSPGSVLDDDAARLDPHANCVTVATDGARQDEFTQGFLADPNGSFRGRLSCETSACTHGSFQITGLPGTYNDDKITDFLNPGSILNSPLFFGLSTYLTDNVPAVTPPSTALKSDIYSSPRFFWTAVASRATGPTACTKCPVLTFRPVFLTQDLPSGFGLTAADILQLQLQIKAGINTASILSGLFPWLGPAATSTDHGVVMDGTKLRALRFQTIEPTTLPPVPLTYNGPVSDYLGVGPKIVRLVK